MKSAEQQKKMHAKLVKIACSVERLKRMICKAQGIEPDLKVHSDEHPDGTKRWEYVEDADVARYVNFANMFLFAGNATIKVVKQEPSSIVEKQPVQLILPRV